MGFFQFIARSRPAIPPSLHGTSQHKENHARQQGLPAEAASVRWRYPYGSARARDGHEADEARAHHWPRHGPRLCAGSACAGVADGGVLRTTPVPPCTACAQMRSSTTTTHERSKLDFIVSFLYLIPAKLRIKLRNGFLYLIVDGILGISSPGDRRYKRR